MLMKMRRRRRRKLKVPSDRRLRVVTRQIVLLSRRETVNMVIVANSVTTSLLVVE